MDRSRLPRRTAVLLSCLCLWADPAWADGVASPKPEPLTETVHGHTLSDEYRWMEDPARADEVHAWIRAESDATQRLLAASPLRADFAAWRSSM